MQDTLTGVARRIDPPLHAYLQPEQGRLGSVRRTSALASALASVLSSTFGALAAASLAAWIAGPASFSAYGCQSSTQSVSAMLGLL